VAQGLRSDSFAGGLHLASIDKPADLYSARIAVAAAQRPSSNNACMLRGPMPASVDSSGAVVSVPSFVSGLNQLVAPICSLPPSAISNNQLMVPEGAR
jgi:hypothetical protein